jgi:hypothetical protein
VMFNMDAHAAVSRLDGQFAPVELEGSDASDPTRTAS